MNPDPGATVMVALFTIPPPPDTPVFMWAAPSDTGTALMTSTDGVEYRMAPPADQPWSTQTFRGVVAEYTDEGGRRMNPDQIGDDGHWVHSDAVRAEYGMPPRPATLVAGPCPTTQPGADAMRFDPSVGDDEIAAWDEILHPERAS